MCVSESSNYRQVSFMNEVNIQETHPNAIQVSKWGFSNYE